MMDVHTFDRLLTFITELQVTSSHECNFVLCGDINVHTSNYADVVINDSDCIDVLRLDYIVDGSSFTFNANHKIFKAD